MNAGYILIKMKHLKCEKLLSATDLETYPSPKQVSSKEIRESSPSSSVLYPNSEISN